MPLQNFLTELVKQKEMQKTRATVRTKTVPIVIRLQDLPKQTSLRIVHVVTRVHPRGSPHNQCKQLLLTPTVGKLEHLTGKWLSE